MRSLLTGYIHKSLVRLTRVSIQLTGFNIKQRTNASTNFHDVLQFSSVNLKNRIKSGWIYDQEVKKLEYIITTELERKNKQIIQ